MDKHGRKTPVQLAEACVDGWSLAVVFAFALPWCSLAVRRRQAEKTDRHMLVQLGMWQSVWRVTVGDFVCTAAVVFPWLEGGFRERPKVYVDKTGGPPGGAAR